MDEDYWADFLPPRPGDRPFVRDLRRFGRIVGGQLAPGLSWIGEYFSKPRPRPIATGPSSGPAGPGDYIASNTRPSGPAGPLSGGPAYVGPVGGGGGGGGYGGLIAQEQQNLAALLQFIREQGDAGINVIQAVASGTAKAASKEEKRIREEYTPERVAETEKRFLDAAEGIAQREAEIAAAAGDPAGRAGVYVAPGATSDWEMLMRTAAPREAQYVSDLGNISADSARSYALAAENEGLSYVGALQSLITTLSVQAQMSSQERQAGYRAAGIQASAASARQPQDWRMTVLEGVESGASVGAIVNALQGQGWQVTAQDVEREIGNIVANRTALATATTTGTYIPPTAR